MYNIKCSTSIPPRLARPLRLAVLRGNPLIQGLVGDQFIPLAFDYGLPETENIESEAIENNCVCKKLCTQKLNNMQCHLKDSPNLIPSVSIHQK